MAMTLYAHDSKYGVFTLGYDPTGFGGFFHDANGNPVPCFTGCKTVSISGDHCSHPGGVAMMHGHCDGGSVTSSLVTFFSSYGAGAPNYYLACPKSGSCGTYGSAIAWTFNSQGCNPSYYYKYTNGLPIDFLEYLGYSSTDIVEIKTS